MELFLFWIVISVLVGVFASSKNRSGFGWGLLSLLISPVITLIIVALLPRKEQASQSLEDKLREIERLKTSGVITEDEYQTKRKAIIESN